MIFFAIVMPFVRLTHHNLAPARSTRERRKRGHKASPRGPDDVALSVGDVRLGAEVQGDRVVLQPVDVPAGPDASTGRGGAGSVAWRTARMWAGRKSQNASTSAPAAGK